MKKIFALILAVMMIATMSVTAFAAENTGGDTTINVKGTYTGAQGAGDKKHHNQRVDDNSHFVAFLCA